MKNLAALFQRQLTTLSLETPWSLKSANNWDDFSRNQNSAANSTTSGANPTTLSYNAEDVKIYSATNSTTRF
jgi:hypothetical protein